MFESLTSRFSGAFSSLRSKGKISTSDIEATCQEIRQALLESDVALSVVEDFIADIRQKSLDALPTLQSGTNQANAIFEIVNLISLVSGAMVIILKLDSDAFNVAAQYCSDESEYLKMRFSNFPVFFE